MPAPPVAGRAPREPLSARQLRHASDLAGGLVPLRAALGWALAAAGRRDETQSILREIESPDDGEWACPYQRAILHTALGETGRALACLEEACEARDEWAVWVVVDPMLDSLRSDPRFLDVAGAVLKRARG